MKASVCLIQPPDYVHSLGLLEVCQLLCLTLESLGSDCSFHVNRIDPDRLNIVVGYHLLAPRDAVQLARAPCVCYQLEQLSRDQGWFSADREAVLRMAPAVWDYSPENVQFLRSRGFPRVAHLPLGYHPRLRRIAHRPEPEKDIDVLFYGSMNARRQAVLDSLRRRCQVQALFGVYGEERDQWISRARVLLNVHFYETKILEQVRLSYLLNNECFVVTEESRPNPFAAGVVSGGYEELAALCERYLADPASRQQCAARGLRLLEQRPMTDYLRPLIDSLPALSAGRASTRRRTATAKRR